MERVAEQLKRLADGSGQRQLSAQKARQAEEMARKMMEQETPEQREELRKLAEELAKSGRGAAPGIDSSPFASRPTPPREANTTPVDARKPATVSGADKPPERTIAEWYSDKPSERDGTAGAPAESIRQAAQGAERAIEGQQIPARYQDLVRRVFRRYAEQAPSASPPK